MSNRFDPIFRNIQIPLISIAFCLVPIFENNSPAQGPEKTVPRTTNEPHRSSSNTESFSPKAYFLKYVSAGEAHSILLRIYGDDPSMRIAPDPRLNLIMVYAEHNRHVELDSMIKQLDGPGETKDLRVFQLKYSDKQQSLNLLQTLLSGTENLRLDVDRQNNAVMAYGPKSVLATITNILQMVDRPNETATIDLRLLRPELQTINGQHLLHQLAEMKHVELATADGMPTAIVKGDAAGIRQFTDSLHELGQPKASNAPESQKSMAIRLIWLVNSKQITESDELDKPSKELAPVLNRLATLGVDDPRVAAQFISPLNDPDHNGKSIQIEGSTLIEGNLVSMSLECTNVEFSADRSAVKAHIIIQAKSAQGLLFTDLSLDLANVELKVGKTVVLGVAPWVSIQSVFAVQLLEER